MVAPPSVYWGGECDCTFSPEEATDLLRAEGILDFYSQLFLGISVTPKGQLSTPWLLLLLTGPMRWLRQLC